MSDPLIGSTLGDYLIESRIGKGGMGVVYAARQLSLDRTVALKVLPAELCADREYVDRFLREARAAAHLNHPNIIQIFDAGVAENIYFFVMEFVDGRNLGQILREHGAFAEREALHAIQQAAVGLAFAHSMGVVHRDVKPENIMISQSGLVKIGDLGLAKWKPNEFEASLTSAGTTMGTPFYIAPEQIRGVKDIDARADIYSLGMTLFHLLAGHPAFGEGSAAEIMARHLSDPLPALRALRSEISEDTGHLLAAMAAKNRADRMQTMEEVADTLSQMLGHPPSNTPRRGLRTPKGRRMSRAHGTLSRILATGIRGVMAGIVGLLVALAVILVLKKTHPRASSPTLSPPTAEVTPAPTPPKTPTTSRTTVPPPSSKPKIPSTPAAPIPSPSLTPKTAPEVALHETPAATVPAPPQIRPPSREPEKAMPPETARSSPQSSPTPEERPAAPVIPARETHPATRDLTLQGAGVFTSLVISPRPEQLHAARGMGGNSRRGGFGTDRFAMPGPRIFNLVASHSPQLEAKSLLRVEFLARDAELARRFLRQLVNCTAATLEITPTEISGDARDLEIEVCRILEAWGMANLPDSGTETEGDMGSSFIDSSGRMVFEGPMALRMERQKLLESETNWKQSSIENKKSWNREGASRRGFDHENTPLCDASNPNRIAFRVSENLNKLLVLDVLPELQHLAEQARDGSSKPFHYGWAIQVSRGTGEARFATAGNQGPRLHLVFGKKDAPAR
ncbi:MAG: serine/threonine protein kinase [Verrucomicrobiia bacterium]